MVAYFMYVASGAWDEPLPMIEVQDTEAQREWSEYMQWLAKNKSKTMSFYEWQEINKKETSDDRQVK